MKRIGIAIVLAAFAAAAIMVVVRLQHTPVNRTVDVAAVNESKQALKKVVINEAARTLLYLPLYHAVEKGYFRDAGIDVKIVTGGTATASFASMLSGEAEFAQADPMYVPISREKGGETKVVAQVVGRIAVWGVTLDPNVKEMTAATLRGRKIATHPRPMTAFTYTDKLIRNLGLQPDKDVELVTSTPGTEIASLLNHQADFMVSVEPNVSKAETQGGHVVLSFAKMFGDQVLTGLMTRETFIKENRDVVVAVVRAYQKALNDIHARPDSALISAKAYFPQLEQHTMRIAIQRLIDDQVFPQSVLISDDSWNKAVAVRVEAGDLKSSAILKESCDTSIMEAGAK
jgi:NitT/TauT family transport system substrate-binding protein